MSAETLYRFYNKDNELLYVGITHRIPDRIGQHRKSKPWQEVAKITLEHYPSRHDVLVAEVEAISEEDPKWNLSPGHVRLADGASKGKATYLTAAQRTLLRGIASRKGPLMYLRHPKDGAAKRAWLRADPANAVNTATVDALIRRGFLIRISREDHHNVWVETWALNPVRKNANRK